MNIRRANSSVRAALTVLCVLTLIASTQLATAKSGVRASAAPAGAEKIETVALQAEDGYLRVVIYLRDQKALFDWQRDRRAAKIAAGITGPRSGGFPAREAARQQQIKRLGKRAERTSRAAQKRLIRLIEAAGGHVSGTFPAPSILFAELPERALGQIKASGLVGAVLPDGDRQSLAAVGTPAWYSGAETWYSAGCTGAGASDTCPSTSFPQNVTGPADSADGHGGPDFGVDDMGVNCHHDAFTGGATPALGRTPSVVRPADVPISAAADNKGCPPDWSGDNGSLHGNTIAAIVAVKDPAHLGAASGVDKILDPTRSCADSQGWLLGLPTYVYSGNSTCVRGTTIPGAADPEEVHNRSYGFPAPDIHAQDDSIYSQLADLGAAQFGVAQAVAAGNGGPYRPLSSELNLCISDEAGVVGCQYRVNHPCVSYNSICVGAAASGGGAIETDEVATYSSRGPSVGGRKKPDLVAPYGYGGCPDGGYSRIMTPEDNALWKGGSICGQGTSYAAPYVAAGQLLLAGVGVTAPAAQKAVLINSAKSITTESTNTVQEFWTPDTGWGELDLARAYAERGNWRTGSVTEAPTSNARFYRVSGQSAHDRTTLTWSRRVVAPLGRHDDLYGWGTASAVTTLDLYQLTLAGADNDADVCGSSTTCGVDASEDTDTGPTVIKDGVVERWATNADNQDTVGQVRAKSAGDSIIKVVANSAVAGADAEPYALASTVPLVPLSTPNLDVSTPIVSAENPLPGQSFTVSVNVKNESAGSDLTDALALEDASANIDLPAGVELVTGTASRQLGTSGTLAPQQTSTLVWTLRRTSEGSGSVVVSASGSRFGETFAASSEAVDVSGDQTPPTLELLAPTGWQPSASNTVTWSATDALSGIAGVRVEVSIDGGLWQQVAQSEAETGQVVVSAGEGQSVRVRAQASDAAGNVSSAQAEGFAVDAIPPTIRIAAPPLLYAEQRASASVVAENVGSPITTSWRINGGPWRPLAGAQAQLGALYAFTRIEAVTYDALGRGVSASASVNVKKNATRVRVKLRGRKKKRSLFVTATPGISGRVKTTVKCGKKRRSKTLRIRSGRATWKLYRVTGRCRVSVRFTPSSTRAYLSASYAKTLRF